nr:MULTISPECIES: CinA family protein [unclassified Pseudomonas]
MIVCIERATGSCTVVRIPHDPECAVKEITQLAAELGRRLQVLNAHVTTAESCTGGGIAEAITRIPGSSAWFEAGYVTYSNRQKTQQLNVPAELFETVGAVSREVVEAMVRGAQDQSLARFAVAVSGVAGPDGGSPNKPVGTVWLAWAVGDAVSSEVKHFAGNRDEVRRQTVRAALEGLLRLAAREIENQG